MNFNNPWKGGGIYRKTSAVPTVNTLHDKFQNIDFVTTVLNLSNYSIWCKDEHSTDVFEVVPNGKTNRQIDGLTHPSRPNEVFKVTTGIDRLFGIVVYNHGLSFRMPIISPLDKEINVLLGGGWLSSPPDTGWNNIFNKA